MMMHFFVGVALVQMALASYDRLLQLMDVLFMGLEKNKNTSSLNINILSFGY